MNENEWMLKKRRKWAMERQRKMKRNKCREINFVEENPDVTQTIKDAGNQMAIRRNWQS